MPRPPIQHVKHIISFDKDAVALIEDLQETWIKAKAIGAAGEAAEGILSNPNLAFLVGGGILALIAGSVGKDIADQVVAYFSSLSALIDAETPEDKSAAAFDLTNALRALIKALSPLGPFTPGV